MAAELLVVDLDACADEETGSRACRNSQRAVVAPKNGYYACITCMAGYYIVHTTYMQASLADESALVGLLHLVFCNMGRIPEAMSRPCPIERPTASGFASLLGRIAGKRRGRGFLHLSGEVGVVSLAKDGMWV